MMGEYYFNQEHKAYVKDCMKCSTTYIGHEEHDQTNFILSEFFAKDRFTKDGFYARCRKCVSAHQRSTRDGRICDPDKLLADQNGKCGICEKPISFERTKNSPKVTAYVDHSHETNQVRGILCPRCNSLLGTKDWLLKSFAYLEKYGE